MIGHNSEAEIIRCINNKLEEFLKSEEKFEKLQEQLDTSKDEEQEAILLEIGRQLLEGRKPFEDEGGKLRNLSGFHAWTTGNFPNLPEVLPDTHDRSAVIWAAERPDDYWDIKERYPRTRTIRGRHAKWREEEAKRKAAAKANDKTDNEDDNDDDVVDPEDTGNDDNKPDSSNSGDPVDNNNPNEKEDNKKGDNDSKSLQHMLDDGEILPDNSKLPEWSTGEKFDPMAAASSLLVGAADLFCHGKKTREELKRYIYQRATAGESKSRDDYKIVALFALRDAINELQDDLVAYLKTDDTSH